VLQHKCHIILTTNILNKGNGQIKMCPLSFGSNVFNYFILLRVCIPRANALLTALYHQNLIRNTQIYNCFILKKKSCHANIHCLWLDHGNELAGDLGPHLYVSFAPNCRLHGMPRISFLTHECSVSRDTITNYNFLSLKECFLIIKL